MSIDKNDIVIDKLTPAEIELASTVGKRIGKAIAKDVLAEGMPRQWTGLDPQDGDQLTAAGIEPNTHLWAMAEAIAEHEYHVETCRLDM